MTKLFHIECLIPAQHLHATMIYLENKKAYNLEVKAYRKNGAGEDEAENEAEEEIEPKPKGQGQTHNPSNREFLYQIISGTEGGLNVAQMREAFDDAGRSGKSVNNELSRLVKDKRVKKSEQRGMWVART